MNKSNTIRIMRIYDNRIMGTNMEGEDKDKIVDIPINKSIYLAMLVEMKKANIAVDEDLNCMVGRIFTIFEREWKGDQIFGAALRKDIEMI